VIYTICGKPFADWVDTRIAERNELRKDERDVEIEMDAEIAAIFKASTAISLSKGTSNNMMKVRTALDILKTLTSIYWNRPPQRGDVRKQRSESRMLKMRSRSDRLSRSLMIMTICRPSFNSCKVILICSVRCTNKGS
jgi:hypothetical protein